MILRFIKFSSSLQICILDRIHQLLFAGQSLFQHFSLDLTSDASVELSDALQFVLHCHSRALNNKQGRGHINSRQMPDSMKIVSTHVLLRAWGWMDTRG
ncbi:hypothetical protein DM860_006852 [Cuscuta australis]|uniref:Uncharacterized protein n=1 Tax=Cuscuta australis TaxID=267555 RepID=A0A328E6J7_9ASTE|nr:hypothetical protein DM860_006852 [Cuscuta australis]